MPGTGGAGGGGAGSFTGSGSGAEGAGSTGAGGGSTTGAAGSGAGAGVGAAGDGFSGDAGSDAGADCLIAVGEPGTTTLLVSSLRDAICSTALAITTSALPSRPAFFRSADCANTISCLFLRRTSLCGSSGRPPRMVCRTAAMTAKLANAASTPRRTRGPRDGVWGAVFDMEKSVGAGDGFQQAGILAWIEAGFGETAEIGPGADAADPDEGRDITGPCAGEPEQRIAMITEGFANFS